ncbi:hypothetical protein B0T11DRAFT_291000 [Plectosphaerella cucumerina]|uniref:Ribosomal protein S19 n=1 Tax=Plectosphaerella cucumerina TaxID=40658 RepID=A0A8K0T193_9PEZI|nr:hypothetical protein B0T11DRAFT_291000 [Plectosphaerella cucumerina]
MHVTVSGQTENLPPIEPSPTQRIRSVRQSGARPTNSATMKPTQALLSRSVWKGPHIVPLPIVRPAPGKKLPAIKTQARAATILPNFVGLRFQVYNGKVYNDFTVTEQMVGHKLGEFSPTRKPFIWSRG